MVIQNKLFVPNNNYLQSTQKPPKGSIISLLKYLFMTKFSLVKSSSSKFIDTGMPFAVRKITKEERV